MKQPNLLLLPQYPLDKYCFTPEQFHKVLYVAINNLVHEGAQEITEIEIENIVKNHPVQMEILQDNNYLDFIANVKELCVLENYGLYYNTVRKLSLLREMQEDGFDIKEFYDELQDEAGQVANLEKWSIQDILNRVELKSAQLRSKYDVKYVRTESWAGEDTEELIQMFEETPAFGAHLVSPYLTQLWAGWCRGHLLMNSAPSGVGKTKMAIADLCNVCCSEIWDDTAQDFVPNLNRQGPGLFIHTELNNKTEMRPQFLACIAGVELKHITQGRLTPEEKNRVRKAGEILLRDKILIPDMPDFTAKSIERKIKECVEGYGMQYMVFDYVQLNSALSFEYKQNTSVQAREDLVLKSLVTELKRMAETYDVGILTMSQLNGTEKNTVFPDEGCLSGAKSLLQKLDGGCITLPVIDRQKEYKKAEAFIQKRGFGKHVMPNCVSYAYKCRFGEYDDQKIKIWRYFDRGRMRNIDFVCTNQYDELVNIPKPVLEGDF